MWGAVGALSVKFRSIFAPYFEHVWRDATAALTTTVAQVRVVLVVVVGV